MSFSHSKSEQQAELNKLRFVADILDTKFKGPFGFRFGLDPIIGLVPILGDLVTLFVSAFIFLQSVQLGVPVVVQLRMLLNILIDQLIKIIPFFGLIFDVMWKANTRNIKLIETFLQKPHQTTSISWGLVIGLFLGFISVAVLTIYATIWIFIWCFMQFKTYH